MAEFDPDAYLSSVNKPAGSGAGFDPDSYLKEFGAGPQATAAVPEQHVSPAMEWADVPGKAAKNLGSSALEFGKNLVEPVLHPIDTAVNLNNLRKGLLQKARSTIRGEEPGPDEKYADAVGQHYKDRYGGWENLKNTLATDPVGALADASLGLTGAGAGVRGAAKAAELAGAAKTANAIGAAGRGAQTLGAYTDPVNLAGKAVSAPFKLGPEQLAMEKAGVEMTPFSAMQGPKGAFKKTEDALGSVPYVGSFIKGAQEKSIKSFNEAYGQQILDPIKKIAATTPGYFKKADFFDVPKGAAGHELIKDVGDKLSTAYNNLLPKISFMPDARFQADINKIINDAATKGLSTAGVNELKAIMRASMRSRGTPVTGPVFKDIQTNLKVAIADRMGSRLPADKAIARALGKVNTAMLAGLERSNPLHAKELQALHQSWAGLTQMERAGAAAIAEGGVFTPLQLLRAAKANDFSIRHRASARGAALAQRFALAAQRTIPSKLPTSGTSERAVAMGLLGGLGGASTVASPFLSLPAAAAAVGMSLPYTNAGMSIFNKGIRPIARSPRALRAGTNAVYRSGQNNRIQQNANPYAPD